MDPPTPSRHLHRVPTTASAEGYGFSTSPRPSPGCTICQATLILIVPAFLKSHGKEEQGLTDQHGFSRDHRHRLAATSDSLPSKLTAPGHVPTFHFSCKSPAWVISDSLQEADRMDSSMLKRLRWRQKHCPLSSAQKNSCSCQVVSGVTIDLQGKVTEILVKMQSEAASASVKAQRFVAKFCDYQMREEVDRSGSLQNTCLDVQVWYPKSTACSPAPWPFELPSLGRDFVFMLPTPPE